MSVKPDTPITRKEMYLDAATGGSSTLPEPVTIEEKYLAKIAGMTVDLPAPVPLKHKFLAKIAGMQVEVPTYTTGLPRVYAYLAKAAGQDVEVPQPITREEMYWFDYVSGQPTPSEQEYTGAVPVTFIANGQPLLDYLISGNAVQNGTPTQGAPIMPEGTGERTAQLIPEIVQGGISTTDGSFSQSSNRVRTKYIAVESGKTYAVSSGNLYLATGCYYNNGVFISKIYEVVAVATSATFTVPENVNQIAIGFRTANGTPNITPSDLQNYMLNEGSTALHYEPYGIKIPILSADTTTNIYLGEVQTTRKIKKLVLKGDDTETYTSSYSGDNRFFNYTLGSTGLVDLISTHFTRVDISSTSTVVGVLIVSGTTLRIRPENVNGMTVADFKTYLQQQYAAGTPVTVWYVLSTEQTGIVNEPLMKIGDYADTLSMEQAGVQIPTVNGSNTLDVLTTVKPSEVYIKYSCEPVPQLSMLSSPGAGVLEELPEEAEEIPEEEEVPEETESITPETEE